MLFTAVCTEGESRLYTSDNNTPGKKPLEQKWEGAAVHESDFNEIYERHSVYA